MLINVVSWLQHYFQFENFMFNVMSDHSFTLCLPDVLQQPFTYDDASSVPLERCDPWRYEACVVHAGLKELGVPPVCLARSLDHSVLYWPGTRVHMSSTWFLRRALFVFLWLFQTLWISVQPADDALSSWWIFLLNTFNEMSWSSVQLVILKFRGHMEFSWKADYSFGESCIIRKLQQWGGRFSIIWMLLEEDGNSASCSMIFLMMM